VLVYYYKQYGDFMKTIRNKLKNKEYAYAVENLQNGFVLNVIFINTKKIHRIYFKTKKEINIFLKNEKEENK
jgi:membrane protease subunit (stomatin/prohibitin family)